MVYQHKSGQTIDLPGDWLREPGNYHVIVQSVDEEPTNKAGQLIDGAAFKVEWSILGGTVEGQREKVYSDTFYQPSPSDTEEKQAKATLKIDRFFIAANLMKPDQLGAELAIDLQQACGRQMVLRLTQNKRDARYLDVWQEIYHIDDPAVAAVPKDPVALARIPKDRRMLGGKPAPAKPAATPAKKPDPASL